MLSVLLSAAPEGIRFSSFHLTNLSLTPKSASLIPYYPIPVTYFRIGSSKNLAIFYSKLMGPEGGIEPDLNYFFPTQCDLTPGSGIKSKGEFELDSNRAGLPV